MGVAGRASVAAATGLVNAARGADETCELNTHLAGTRMTLALSLTPEIRHGGRAWVVLPEPPVGHRWRVEWRVVGTDDWHPAAVDPTAGAHPVPDTETPAPQQPIEWRAVAVRGGTARDGELRCTVCGAAGAVPQGYAHPDWGPVALCEGHRHSELDWT